jgi:glyoxylase-like metal-dependent hydrolase (beta-lactamase superfamily II)
MEIVEVLPHLHMLLPEFGQAYLWCDAGELTLIDTGMVGSAPAIADAIRDLGHVPEDVRRVVLTHCHEDHCGSAAEIAGWGDVEIVAHRLEAPVIRGAATAQAPVITDFERPYFEAKPDLPPAPPVTVHREVDDGDTLGFGGGARVIAVPGHTDGSIAIYLPRDRALFTGDAVANPGRTMLGVFNTDRARAIESFHRLAALDTQVACFGHGDPITTDAAKALREAADLTG